MRRRRRQDGPFPTIGTWVSSDWWPGSKSQPQDGGLTHERKAVRRGPGHDDVLGEWARSEWTPGEQSELRDERDPPRRPVKKRAARGWT